MRPATFAVVEWVFVAVTSAPFPVRTPPPPNVDLDVGPVVEVAVIVTESAPPAAPLPIATFVLPPSAEVAISAVPAATAADTPSAVALEVGLAVAVIVSAPLRVMLAL